MLRVEDERARGEGRESFFGAGTQRELSPGDCRTRSTRHEGAEALLAGLQLGGRLRGGGQGEEEAQRTDGGGGHLWQEKPLGHHLVIKEEMLKN